MYYIGKRKEDCWNNILKEMRGEEWRDLFYIDAKIFHLWDLTVIQICLCRCSWWVYFTEKACRRHFLIFSEDSDILRVIGNEVIISWKSFSDWEWTMCYWWWEERRYCGWENKQVNILVSVLACQDSHNKVP